MYLYLSVHLQFAKVKYYLEIVSVDARFPSTTNNGRMESIVVESKHDIVSLVFEKASPLKLYLCTIVVLFDYHNRADDKELVKMMDSRNY